MLAELSSNFYDLSTDELMDTDGGIGWPAVVLVVVIIVAVACTAKGCADADREDGN